MEIQSFFSSLIQNRQKRRFNRRRRGPTKRRRSLVPLCAGDFAARQKMLRHARARAHTPSHRRHLACSRTHTHSLSLSLVRVKKTRIARALHLLPSLSHSLTLKSFSFNQVLVVDLSPGLRRLPDTPISDVLFGFCIMCHCLIPMMCAADVSACKK